MNVRSLGLVMYFNNLFWETLFIKKNGNIVNSYIPSSMIWSRSTVDSHQKSDNQSETAEDGKNGFLKILLNFCEFCTVYKFVWAPQRFLIIKLIVDTFKKDSTS